MAVRLLDIDRRRVLGVGAYGSVYGGTFRGVHQVAIKRMELNRLLVDDSLNREHDALRRLNHPNVLKLFHREDDDDFRYLVLELCDGTLGDFLSAKYQGLMPCDSKALKQMVAGVEHIHSNNLVHRDINPNNILISNSATSSAGVQLKISDFGYCKQTTERGTFSMSAIRGTETYFAPELLAAPKQPNIRGSTKSDIFALGCVFFKFLTRGTHPFGNDAFTNGRIAKGEFNLKDLPEDHFAFNIIERTIRRNPEDRPDILEVAEEFERIKDENKRARFPKKLKLERASVSSRECYEPGETGDVWHCLFHPSKAKLACALDGGGRVCIFSAPNFSTAFQQWHKVTWKATTDYISCFDWNVDGSKLAAGSKDGTLVVWEENGTMSFEIRKHKDRICCIQWNKTGENSHLLVTGSGDKTAIVWDSSQQITFQTFLHFHWITDVTWISADIFASCSFDKTLKIWQVGEQTEPQMFHGTSVFYQVRWLEGGQRLVSCSRHRPIEIWPLNKGDPIATLTADGFPMNCIDCYRRSVGDDYRWWIVGGSGLKQPRSKEWQDSSPVYLWDWKPDETPAAPRKFTKHSTFVCSVAFSPDGQYIASMDRYGSVIIWLIESGSVVFEIETSPIDHKQVKYHPNFHLSWLPSGNKLAVPIQRRKARVIEFDD